MPLSIKSPETRRFALMDKIFWLLWALLPILAILLYREANDPETYTLGLTELQAACIKSLPLPSNYTTIGKIAFNCLLGFDIAFYALLFGILHRSIRRFAKGSVFDDFTLKNMRLLGIALIGYSIAVMLLRNLVSYILVLTGDSNLFTPVWFVDIGPIAVGIFVLALMQVLKNAIDIKTENDLTI